MPKKKIIIDGIIGWDVTGRQIRRQLEEAESQEVLIEIASPGGFVYDGLEIFNIIRDYSRNTAKVTTRIIGLAASMASYIALAGDIVEAEDNTVYMIHNAWNVTYGDYLEMQRNAKFLEGISNLLAKMYAKKSGKSLKAIRELMDGESWYFGDEAKEAGFIDVIIETEKDEDYQDKETSVIVAKARVSGLFEKMAQSEKANKDLEKAAALLTKMEIETPKLSQKELDDIVDDIINEPKTQIKTEVKIMNLQELLSQNPEAKVEFEKQIQEAKDIGEKNVQDRINAVMPFLDNENYSGMKNLTAEVLSGKTELVALKSAAATIDQFREDNKSKAAKKDTDANPDTDPLNNNLPKENGEVESEEDFQAAIARKKGGK